MTLEFRRKPARWATSQILGGRDRGGGSYDDPAIVRGHVWGAPMWEGGGRVYPGRNGFSHYGQTQNTVDRTAGRAGLGAQADGTITNRVILNNSASSLRLQKPLPLSVEAIVEQFTTTSALQMNIIFQNCSDNSVYAGITCGINASNVMTCVVGDNTGNTSTDRRNHPGTTVLDNNRVYHLIWSFDTHLAVRLYINGHPETLGSGSGTGGAMAYDTNEDCSMFGGGLPNGAGFIGRIYLLNYLTRPIFDAEARCRANDPWFVYKDRDFRQ